MKTIERFVELMEHDCIDTWRDQLFAVGHMLGYQHTSLAIFPSRDTQIQTVNAYLHTSLPDDLLCKYDEENMGEIDPIVSHCMARSTPLIWSQETFTTVRQRQLYEEACSCGARAGIALPYHGPDGQMGLLCFATDRMPDEDFRREARVNIPELSCFRDFILEIFSGFMKRGSAVSRHDIEITSRELECLKWCAVGKSSWDIAQLLNCTEATVNFHFANIRRKFGASSRRLAIIKAIRMGFITL